MKPLDWIDLLVALDALMCIVLVVRFVQMTVSEPARYLWTYMTRPWILTVAYFVTQFTCVLVIARVFADDRIFAVALSLVVSVLLYLFFSYQHNLSGWYLSKDVAENLPGSCPVCTLYRAGEHYEFRKRGDPIPEHPECEEKQR
jgi:hypothetical protein